MHSMDLKIHFKVKLSLIFIIFTHKLHHTLNAFIIHTLNCLEFANAFHKASHKHLL